MVWWTRGLTLLLAMLVLGAAGAFLGFLWTGEEFAAGRTDLIQFSAQMDSTLAGRVIGSVIAGAAMLVALLAVLASWATRAQQHLIPLRRGTEREPVLVETETIAHHVADAALATEHVEGARASVTPDGAGSVAIALDLQIDEDAETGSVVSAVDRRVASALEARYGIRMTKKPNVDVRHVSRRHGHERGAPAATVPATRADEDPS